MEHDLYPAKELERRMWKITKGAGFGRQPYCIEDLASGMISDWFEARPGTPLQYLDRLLLVNDRIFPGMNRLEGFIVLDEKFSILTSQPFFVGRNATGREITAFFAQAGFVEICHGTWFREEDGLAIFDVGETNLVLSNGFPIPIDVIPLIPEGRFLEKLREALAIKNKGTPPVGGAPHAVWL